jgi:hypothetical protein
VPTVPNADLCFLLPDSALVGGLLPGPSYLSTAVLLPWACLVGLSRVMKGRHFPLDILFGALIGTALGSHMESHSRRLPPAQTQEVRIPLSLSLSLSPSPPPSLCASSLPLSLSFLCNPRTDGVQVYMLDYKSSQWMKAVGGTVLAVEWGLCVEHKLEAVLRRQIDNVI